MIEIKICGITNEREISYLNFLKPEYAGFVLAKSKRQITYNKADNLCELLDESIKRVGVFRNNSIEEILNISSKVMLDIVQLHGEEDEEFIKVLRGNLDNSIKLWKAFSIEDIKNYNTFNANKNKYEKFIDNFLIDGVNPGSGESFSLENSEVLFGNDQISSHKKNEFFLAGGINEDNVLERINLVNPSGIDVSSGVEIVNENGKREKSFEKMKSLIEKVRNI